MSCRTTHGGVAATALARATSGLDDAQVASIYHRIKREAGKAGVEAPNPDEVAAWAARARRDVAADPDLTEKDRARILRHLDRVDESVTAGDVPDGATFAAWQRAATESVAAQRALDAVLRDAARQQENSRDRVAAKFRKWRRDPESFEDIEAPDPAFRIPTDGLPADKTTKRALRKLGWENYLAQKLPVFTYGTLREGQGNVRRLEGAVGSRTIGRADGIACYGVGWGFPYADEGTDGDYTIGDLVHLTDDQNGRWSRQSMDQLEGFSSDHPTHSHYRRIARPITYTDETGQAQTTTAWVYLAGAGARSRIAGVAKVPGGDWVAANRAAESEWRTASAARARATYDFLDDEQYERGSARATYDFLDDEQYERGSARESAAAFTALLNAEEGAAEHGGFLSQF